MLTKTVLIKVLFLAMILGITVKQSYSVDYHPKRLHKEIEKLFHISVYQKEEIEIKEPTGVKDSMNGKIFKLSSEQSLLGYVYIGRVYSCRKDGCSIPVLDDPEDFAEFFDYFILYSPSFEIFVVVVYNYEATHGQEITARGWLNQFAGYSGENELRVGKEIDAISGATISVHGITQDIENKTRMLKKLLTKKNKYIGSL